MKFESTPAPTTSSRVRRLMAYGPLVITAVVLVVQTFFPMCSFLCRSKP
jgi:hypothetical protein